MTREDAEHRALQLYPDIENAGYTTRLHNQLSRGAYIQCWEDMQQNKRTCGFCVEPSEKAMRKEALIELTQMGDHETEAKGSCKCKFPIIRTGVDEDSGITEYCGICQLELKP